MTVHKLKDGTCVISNDNIYLPGYYENKKAAEFAFKISDDAKQDLQDAAYFTGNRVIAWQDIKDYRARYE
tara:strand:+ start:21989 stop:22198 length:210 start_codon:yes stop_codon:yes gene_type:complete